MITWATTTFSSRWQPPPVRWTSTSVDKRACRTSRPVAPWSSPIHLQIVALGPAAIATPARPIKALLAAVVCTSLVGCAAWTNPVANGIPVRLLPPELHAPSKENLEDVPLALLRQRPPEVYLLAPGDLLGVYIEGVLGKEDELPPVNFSDRGELPPSLGYPIVIRENGTLPLPMVKPVKVEGLTLEQAEQTVKRAYTVEKHVLLTGEERLLVTLIRPRRTKVLVIREDSPEGGIDVRAGGFRGIRGGNVIRTGRPRGSGAVVELPAYQNDVLTALAQTGGLPGDDAEDEVIIQRGFGNAAGNTDAITRNLKALANGQRPIESVEGVQTVRIPLRLPQGQRPQFSSQDIILRDSDIVYVRARNAEYYYTGALLPALEVPLPRDYDLDVTEAVTRVGGPILNGGVNANNLQGGLVAPGLGNPSPSLLTVLRRAPSGGRIAIRVDLNRALKEPRENILVQAEDILLLQETPGQAFARYTTHVFGFSLFSDIISRADTTGTVRLLVPGATDRLGF